MIPAQASPSNLLPTAFWGALGAGSGRGMGWREHGLEAALSCPQWLYWEVKVPAQSAKGARAINLTRAFLFFIQGTIFSVFITDVNFALGLSECFRKGT